jgi:hypothetical protein
MNPVPEIKRFLLRALARLKGIPWPDELLEESARQSLVPKPLLSDIREARRDLEAGGYLQGHRDEMDGAITWTLTAKGQHAARQLE